MQELPNQEGKWREKQSLSLNVNIFPALQIATLYLRRDQSGKNFCSDYHVWKQNQKSPLTKIKSSTPSCLCPPSQITNHWLQLPQAQKGKCWTIIAGQLFLLQDIY